MTGGKPLSRVLSYEGSYDEVKANKRKKTMLEIQNKYTRCPHCGLFTDKTKSGKCRNCGFRWVEDGD